MRFYNGCQEKKQRWQVRPGEKHPLSPHEERCPPTGEASCSMESCFTNYVLIVAAYDDIFKRVNEYNIEGRS